MRDCIVALSCGLQGIAKLKMRYSISRFHSDTSTKMIEAFYQVTASGFGYAKSKTEIRIVLINRKCGFEMIACRSDLIIL